MPVMTQAEYARRRGVSKASIHTAVKTERIVLTAEGLVDSDAADASLRQNTTQPKAAYNGVLEPVAGKATLGGNDKSENGKDAGIGTGGYDLQAARAKREFHEANLAEMRERKRSAELVEWAAVEKANANIYALLLNSLDRIPDKLADRLAAETDPFRCRALLATEITQCRTDLADALTALAAQLTQADGS